MQENLKYTNGFYSENNRFARSDSRIVPLNIAKQQFREKFLDKVDVMVGHALSNDFKVLKVNGMPLNIRFLDTADIGAIFMNEKDKVSLGRLLEHLDIDHRELHNAANDVEYTLEAFFKMGDL